MGSTAGFGVCLGEWGLGEERLEHEPCCVQCPCERACCYETDRLLLFRREMCGLESCTLLLAEGRETWVGESVVGKQVVVTLAVADAVDGGRHPEPAREGYG